MFKRFLILFFIGVSITRASDLVKIYLDQGLEAVGVEIEKELMDKNFWLSEIADKNVSLGYYSSKVDIVLTNKTDKILRVYSYDNGKIKKDFEQKSIITGLMGDKKVEGDLKTPIGFYELGQKFNPGDPYYGPFAFATTYPNLLDKVQGKTGGGIWIHGYPLDGTRIDEFKTKGCIALFNENLEKFAKIVQDRKVFVMTEEKDKVRANKEEIASLFADLFAWKFAWTNNNIDSYLEFYDQNEFKRFDKMKFEQFASMKKAIFSRKENKKIKFSDINISPYPNLNNEVIYRISFYEDYYTKNYQFKGNKTLYVKLNDKGKMKILAEQ
ncbi:murein L,D-transpeptidase family protein [Campylobacter sp. LH-2024]|uniref:Murein L,D-transpeptidase n=1 Tax=Campylobacter molothri TaxID=1032242 RepID=A0ACC5VZ14_9BACT|nr:MULTISPECIES: murein L,D-transpeptidase family protein [unclassified Campylobacter]MBZ7927979.1 murein L,D-transpeptidase [Campylobacter sp. RM10542]MBZ7931292.1 murein L,D-transpeptidase [Campylobacter sp. RM12910]MBZ7932117.1 murein L,D-transpeptidase [Campylobacter sp. RM10543]MBZ7937336.1 murein L,D-transpeptidase [Campylobacter sp. RM10538]MBZ7940797.1 murein L,D-transpeptidase [Campylobacter sp. W0047]MBZ7941416.1 murein L,D-transpeptidase [Campylobacter sp. W0045]MBZ7944591.1 murei